MSNYIKGEKSKEYIIQCAAELFWKNGYCATGINDILNAAGLSKGSFYFYFESKKHLAASVADYFNKTRMDAISKIANNKNWTEFAEQISENLIERAENNHSYGCPFATLGAEIAFSEPELSLKCYDPIKNITAIFKDVLLRTGFDKENAEALAQRAMAIYEGYLLFYRMSKDISQLHNLSRDLKALAEHI
ncbi:MAG: TetR/AcrR family transcriptional regulator [Eubacteriaceae bacterium]|nr:TetR/AcrR family transcriptional regulator [Eubacteriaceae bacterium]